jgi:hypothetical protein
MSSVTGPRMWCCRTAASPVTTLPGPAYSIAAISCWMSVGVPVVAR